jgi:hypothetical protein
MIRTDDSLKGLTRQIRDEGKEKQKILPFITPSGLFKTRKKEDLITYTGILCIDLDKVPDITIVEKIKTDPQFKPGLVFISPSGNGIKIFYRVQNAVEEDHLLYLKTFYHYLQNKFNLAADESCTDIPRACFLCHDPNAYLSVNSVDSSELLNYAAGFSKPVEKRTLYETDPEFKSVIEMIKSSPVIHARALRNLENEGWKNSSGIYWTRPGKEKGTSGTYRQEGNGYHFMNFSSNVRLQTWVNHDDIDLIAFYEFGGDNAKCIKTLAKELELTLPRLREKKQVTPADKDADAEYFDDRDCDQLLAEGDVEPGKKIIGSFLYENTITYLFSRTNYGKSLLAFQFAYMAATGESLAPPDFLTNQCDPMKVLVVDLEMEAKDIVQRHKSALREMNPEHRKNLHYLHEKPGERILFGESLLKKIEAHALRYQSNLIIIDNLSKLLPDSLNHENVSKVISALKRIRQRTGASFLVIGHTTKGNPKLRIQESDYFGSSMIQNFFSEVSYLDKTIHEKFFLCQIKTKHPECCDREVPVFSRGYHNKLGIGFTYEETRTLDDVQLPANLAPPEKARRRNLKEFIPEINLLDKEGIPRNRIAEMLEVSRGTLYKLFEK